MRKRILLLLICILLTLGSFDAASYPPGTLTEEEALITSFESTGASVLESMISCWTKFNDQFLTIDQIDAEMNRVVNYINPDTATIVKDIQSDDQLNKIVLNGSKGEKAYSIAIESIKHQAGGETYIIIDVSMDNSYRELEAEKQNIIKAVQAEERQMNFSSCIIGTYKGKLDEKETDKKSRIALQAINAKKVEGIENTELKSISAFSNSVDSYIMTEQERVNVQLAIRYSSYDDKTYIWIGTPLIPIEY